MANILKHAINRTFAAMDDLLELRYTLGTIDEAARQFWKAVEGHRIFAFRGEMGAGKTTFIHHLCDHLGVTDTVSSPTFALINEYHYSGPSGGDEVIYHLDWYRLRDTAEAINAGLEDCIREAERGSARCFIEWPEKATGLLGMPHILVSIRSVGNNEREMKVSLAP